MYKTISGAILLHFAEMHILTRYKNFSVCFRPEISPFFYFSVRKICLNLQLSTNLIPKRQPKPALYIIKVYTITIIT